MTIGKWKKKFYPSGPITKNNALDRSLLLWEGLHPETLEQYGLEKGKSFGVWGPDQTEFNVYADTEPLCQVYMQNQTPSKACQQCPLYKVRNAKCYESVGGGSKLSPYLEWTQNDNPDEMIKLLKKAKYEGV